MPTDANSVTLSGRLVADGELREVGDTHVLACRIGFNTYSKTGDYNAKSNFIDVEVWGRYAEAMADHAIGGRQCVVLGALQFDEWEKDGSKRSKHKVSVRGSDHKFIIPKGQNGNGNGNGSSKPKAEKAEAPKDESTDF
jgi:single-strand DNA-binding protein